jgi:hypothetical protein
MFGLDVSQSIVQSWKDASERKAFEKIGRKVFLLRWYGFGHPVRTIEPRPSLSYSTVRRSAHTLSIETALTREGNTWGAETFVVL